MNNKWKIIATSFLVVGALTACNTDRDTAMENPSMSKMSTRDYHNDGTGTISRSRSWNANRVSYDNDGNGVPDHLTAGTAKRFNTTRNDLGITGTNVSYRYRDYTGMTGTGTYPGAGTRNVGTTRSGAGATGTGAGMTGTGAGVGNTSMGAGTYSGRASYPSNIGMMSSDQIYGTTGTRDYNINRVTNRYSNPDMDGYNRFYNANRVTNRETRTDDYGNVKYSEVNQKMKKLSTNNASNPNYNYYGSRNYHGHLTNNANQTPNVTINDYNADGSGATSEKIRNSVKNLRDVDRVAVVTYGNDVLVAVKPRNAAATGTLESDVQRAAQQYANGRTVHVTVTKTMYDRVRSMSNRLKSGAMTNNMNRDMTDLFRTLRADYNRVVK